MNELLTDGSVRSSQTATLAPGDAINAFSVELRYQQSDLASLGVSTPASTTQGGSTITVYHDPTNSPSRKHDLSAADRAGVGLGGVIGFILVFGLSVYLTRVYRKKLQASTRIGEHVSNQKEEILQRKPSAIYELSDEYLDPQRNAAPYEMAGSHTPRI
jgi:hypothetical protein